MLKSLFGGSVTVASTLLISSLIFYPIPSVGETHTQTSQELQAQQKSDASATAPDNIGIAEPVTETAPAATPDAANETSINLSTPPGLTPASKTAAEIVNVRVAPPQTFTATAYSLRGRTASGKHVGKGVIAADHRVLPLGTRVRLEAGSYSGEYLVADTGGAMRGRKIDVWVPNNKEAFRFGRRGVKLTVLNYSEKKAKQRAGARR